MCRDDDEKSTRPTVAAGRKYVVGKYKSWRDSRKLSIMALRRNIKNGEQTPISVSVCMAVWATRSDGQTTRKCCVGLRRYGPRKVAYLAFTSVQVT